MTLDVFLTIFFLIFVIAAAIVVFQLLKFRGSQKTLLETTRHLGFTPGLPNGNFAHRIDALYQIPGESNRFEVQQACYKIQSDSLMVIFDLVETGGVDYSTCERQAVAVQSARLDLPHLVVIPRINRLLSAVIEHGLKSWGTQLRFPGQPAPREKIHHLLARAGACSGFLHRPPGGCAGAQPKPDPLHGRGHVLAV